MTGNDRTQLPFDDLGEEFFFFVTPLNNSPWFVDGCTQNPLYIHHAGVGVCTAGSATVMIGSTVHQLTTGTMCVLLPDSMLYILGRSSDFAGFAIATHAAFIYHAVRYNVQPKIFFEHHPIISLKDDELAYMDSFYHLCLRLQDREAQVYGTDIRKHLLAAFLFELLGMYEEASKSMQQSGGRRHEHFEAFMASLRQHYKTERSVEFYADKLCISARYLNLICRELTEHSASECISDYVAMHIALSLITTDHSILELSEEYNFSTPSYFIRFFKQHEGMTPLQFRRRKGGKSRSGFAFPLLPEASLG